MLRWGRPDKGRLIGGCATPGQAVDVDEYPGLGQAQLHHRDEAVPAREHAGARRVPGQQRQGVRHAGGLLVLDLRGNLQGTPLWATGKPLGQTAAESLQMVT